jgi:site-specific DNA recombinase
VAGDNQNRILIIPWTPPSPHRRREIIQGEGERPSATRPMRSEARAILTDALRDAHRWLDELATSPNQTIESLAAREGKTERWIRRTISLAFLCPALVKARSTVDCLAALGSSAWWTFQWRGRTNGRRWG